VACFGEIKIDGTINRKLALCSLLHIFGSSKLKAQRLTLNPEPQSKCNNTDKSCTIHVIEVLQRHTIKASYAAT
jgi:hypothetical protein